MQSKGVCMEIGELIRENMILEEKFFVSVVVQHILDVLRKEL